MSEPIVSESLPLLLESAGKLVLSKYLKAVDEQQKKEPFLDDPKVKLKTKN